MASRQSHAWGSIHTVASAAWATRPFTSFACTASVALPGGRPPRSKWILPVVGSPDGVTFTGAAPWTVARVMLEGSSASPEGDARKVASMLAEPVAPGVTASTCVAGDEQSGTLTHETSWPSWNAVVPTLGSSTVSPSSTITYSAGPEAIPSNCATRQSPSVVVMVVPGCDHPLQLVTTWTSSAALVGWYQTVTEHDRAGIAGDDGELWQPLPRTIRSRSATSACERRTRLALAPVQSTC